MPIEDFLKMLGIKHSTGGWEVNHDEDEEDDDYDFFWMLCNNNKSTGKVICRMDDRIKF